MASDAGGLMKEKILDGRGKGEVDYDYADDILFFRIKDRKYEVSVELDDAVIDFDDHNFIVGIQIFGASKFFRVPKESLKFIKKWEYEAQAQPSVNGSKIEIRLFFSTRVKNRNIMIIKDNISRDLPENRAMAAT